MKRTTKKTEIIRNGHCMDCKNAYLMRSTLHPKNPLICLCAVSHQRFPASWKCQLRSFLNRITPMEVHEMIPLKKH